MGHYKNYLLAGSGKSGLANLTLLRYLNPESKIFIYDDAPITKENHIEMAKQGALILKEGDLSALPSGPGEFFPSPGISPSAQVCQTSLRLGWTPQSDVAYVFSLATKSQKIGITGTNGKSTVTKMIEHILKKKQRKALACGNIGLSVSTAYLQNPNLDYLVAELSSYQLEWSGPLACDYGVFTSFSSDHLDRHKTMEKYFEEKLNLFRSSQLRLAVFDQSSFDFLCKLGYQQAVSAPLVLVSKP